MTPLTLLPATIMAAMVRRKEVSPVELVEAHLSRIEKLNPLLNAFVRVDAERSRQSARTAEAAVMRGEPAGLLHGVPLTIKSSIDVAGLPSETGSRLRAGRMAPADAPIVARLKAAGAIIMGNTNAPEMLMSWETDNSLYGRTNNPWDLERTAGGSSGGESAAIAAGLSAAGVGSDGGGSIRVPAHFTGICGLKPTPGRIPSTGHYPPSLGPFSLIGVVGPMARTVSDLCAMFEVMTGTDDGDPISSPVPLRWPDEAELRKIRIGYFEDDDRTPVTPETRAAVRSVAQAMKQSGFEVEPFRPDVLQRARDFWWVMFGQSGEFVLRPTLAACEDEISPTLKEFLMLVTEEPPLTAERVMQAWVGRDELRVRLLEQMRRFAILLCPVCSIPAFRHGERRWMVDGRQARYLRDPDVMTYAQWWNLLGNPAAVVPVGRSPEGLPIGIQVVGRPYEDEVVLVMADEIEKRCGGGRLPPAAI